MLQAISALNGYGIEASDGRIGSVGDFLFDDRNWRLRWLVVDTGRWLTGRKVLLHPSAIENADYEGEKLLVTLTKAQVEASPDILEDDPVSSQMERALYDHYGWDAQWAGGYLGESSGAMASPFAAPPMFGLGAAGEDAVEPGPHAADPHLRSVAEVKGYHLHARDGDIGHVESFLVDSVGWAIRYLVVDTRNWWAGKQILMSPHAVTKIDWINRHIHVDVTRAQVKASPPWDPLKLMDQDEMRRLHSHYGWPGSAA